MLRAGTRLKMGLMVIVRGCEGAKSDKIEIYVIATAGVCFTRCVFSSSFFCVTTISALSSSPPISRYNPKSTETLVGGSYNGLVNFFDLRKPGAQVVYC